MPDAAAGPSVLSELLARTIAAYGDQPAVIDSRRTLTWREIGKLAEGYAAQLRDAGVGRGDRVALWLPNCADYLAAIFAVTRIGAIAVHVNTRFRAYEAGSVFRRAAPSILITDFNAPEDYGQVLADIPVQDKASLTRILIRGGPEPVPALDGVPVQPLRAAGGVDDTSLPEDPCAIFTTTGSTGEPKLVLHGQRRIVDHHIFAARRLGFDQPGAVLLANLPFCGVYGHSRLLMAAIGGASVVLQYSANTDALIRRHRITHVAGFADALARLVDQAGGRPLDSMRVFSVAVSPFVDNDAVFAAAEALGLRLLTAYSSTETNNSFVVPPDDWGTTTGGVPVHPDARFAIRDPDTGVDLPEGEPGQLLIASPCLFLCYYGDPEATAAAWTEDGLFRTGDRAYRRGDGFVFLGRYDDTIRLGGVLVDPSEIETFLRLRPGVAAARVVAADSGNGARVVAFVVARPGFVVDEATLVEECREQIASFKVPARIVVLDEFPVSEGANGRKIRLDVLREMAASVLRDGAA